MRKLLLLTITASLAFSSNIFIDPKTDLTWQDNITTKDTEITWDKAKFFCSVLRLNKHNDWRLPSVKELETIIEISQHETKDDKGFKYIGDDGYYWSGTEHETQEEFAWIMNFKRGYEYINYKTYERFVRCVRGEMKKIE